jgi:hypothetical protein
MRLAARKKLLEAGFRETLTYAFRKKGAYEVARGVGDKGALRTNLSDGFKNGVSFANATITFVARALR